MALRGRSLSSQVQHDFTRAVRERGSGIASRRVDITRGDQRAVAAIVSGTVPYHVDLRLDRQRLFVSCTCPYFEGTGPCKHIWATILRAEREGYFDPIPERLDLVEDDPVEDEDWDEDDWDEPEWDRPRPPLAAPPRSWREQLPRIQGPGTTGPRMLDWPADREIVYILDLEKSVNEHVPVVELAIRDRKRDGQWSVPRSAGLPQSFVNLLPDPADREILSLVCGASTWSSYTYDGHLYGSVPSHWRLWAPFSEYVLPRVGATGRLFHRPPAGGSQPVPIAWEDGEPWRAVISLEPAGDGDWQLNATLRRGDDRMSVRAPQLMLSGGGWLLADGRLSRFRDEWLPLVTEIRTKGPISVPRGEEQELLEHLHAMPSRPEIELPEELRYETVQGTPRPCLFVEHLTPLYSQQQRLAVAQLSDYDGVLVDHADLRESIYTPANRRLTLRDREREETYLERLRGFGLRPLPDYLARENRRWEIGVRRLDEAIPVLLGEGWHVEVDGAGYRQPGEFRLDVSSGIDWFDLDGGVDFGSSRVRLPALLKALQSGQKTVKLEDGSYGLVPHDLLDRLKLMLSAGEEQEDVIRFRRNQAALLDALLATQPAVSVDEQFRRARERMNRFEGIRPADQPPGFQGSLRGYQREGLAWFEFLEDFGFGGCLADDMGVGKTIQVLALLEKRRASNSDNGDDAAPSLAVVPRSLIFNWMEEARRFTPELHIVDYTGPGRSVRDIRGADLALTTYGTLRRDVVELRKIPFDYVILDEAQAIKNHKTAAAKATRLLDARHRLALTGTPVENHIGELWSIFEFLNPGMLGASKLWHTSSGSARSVNEESREVMRRALRPYILRRTKAQVAAELPEKLEQTLYCELQTKQRKLYTELRDFYRGSLLGRIESHGLARSKIQVLEALLRLRQAACHPALLDEKRGSDASAKFEALLPMLEEVFSEGHKALVFSQFTSLLALLRPILDKQRIPYEYLDGQTRDRQPRVKRFQTDPDCRLFLISLKAGGLGLNLTAASYVFLLDPWWNPAVEAQAIDRTHRIGQKNRVFAYRIIARDTVEEKVLELQKSKRDLAEAIISEDNSLIRDLQREDLDLLLS